MNRTTKRTIIIICAVVLLIAALLYFTPWPTRVNVQMTGMEVTADGTSIHSCTVHIKGWKLNYLFRNDAINLDLQVIGENSLALNGHQTSCYPLSEEFDNASWGVYLAEKNQMDALSVYLGKDLNWLVFSVNNQHFVAAANENTDLQVYWEKCADYVG